MDKKKFVKMMETKLTYGDCISNEDIMRGLLLLLTDEDNIKKIEEIRKCDDFDATSIAQAFFNSHRSALPSEIEKDAKKLRKELTFIQYNDVISEISKIDGGTTYSTYKIKEIVREMNNA